MTCCGNDRLISNHLLQSRRAKLDGTKQMRALMLIFLLTATSAFAAEKVQLCDAVLYNTLLFEGVESAELIITGEISKLSNNKKSVDIFDPNKKDCESISVYLKKQAPKDCKVGRVATVQGKVKLDDVLGELFDGLTNATITCTASTPARFKDFRELTRDEALMVQTFLYDYLGYVTQGPPDGIMNDQTRGVLAKAQKEAGFKVTGELTKDQFDLIQNTLKDPPPPERQWTGISITTLAGKGHVIASKVKTGSKAYREAEAKCKEEYPSGDCVTGVTYGTESQPKWVAGMWCSSKQYGLPFVSFGDTKQGAYDLVIKQIEKAGIPVEKCDRVAAATSDGTGN